MRRLLIVPILLSCSSEELVPRVTGVVAEVHLHQYDQGSHAAAGFIDSRVPYRDEVDEVLVNFVIDPVIVEGGCRLTVTSLCTPTCPGETQYCSNGRCLPYEQLRFQDGGPIKVTGSSHVSPVTLAYNRKTGVYQSDQPFSTPVFRPGDRITVESSGPWPYRAELIAPARPIAITPLLLPPSGPFLVEWEKVEGQKVEREQGQGTIVLRLSAVGVDASGTFITCVADDTGSITIPASMMARVPPPPRFVQLDLERRVRQKIVVRPGELAVVTLAATLVRDRND